MSDDRDDDVVGYGKPPQHSRFRKGQSGNPKGRPKGARNFATDLDEVLKARMTVSESGAPKRVSTQQAVLMRLREKALRGDARALERLLALAADRSAEQEAQSAERSLSANEAEILERYDAMVLRDAGFKVAPDTAEEDPDAE